MTDMGGGLKLHLSRYMARISNVKCLLVSLDPELYRMVSITFQEVVVCEFLNLKK